MSQNWRGAPRPTGWENYPYKRNRVSDQPLRTIAAGGCWCGLPQWHPWPGKDEGVPHPRGEELTAMVSDYERRKEERAQAHASSRLEHNQLKKFKREIRDAVLLLVNTHGVEFRLQADGQHLHLYSGARGERPFKVAASRSVAAQMRLLVPWVSEHFPEIDLASGKAKKEIEMEIPKPTEVFVPKKEPIVSPDGPVADWDTEPNPPPLNVRIEPEGWKPPDTLTATQVLALAAEPEKTGAEILGDGWERYSYPTKGLSTVFEVKGDLLRCTAKGCTYTKQGNFAGVHMHEATHTGEAEEMRRKGAEVKREKQERRAEMLAETLDVLLRPHGYIAVKAEDASLLKEAVSLREELIRLRAAHDELRAKFDLAKEAFGL